MAYVVFNLLAAAALIGIDQAIKLANDQPIETIPPFTGTLVLRESVTTGPYYK